MIAPDDAGEEADPRVFVANEDGTYHCPDCVPPNIDLGSEDVNTWLEGSDGWLAEITCCACGMSIDVVVNGDEE